MKKLFDIDVADDFKRARVFQIIIIFLVFSISFLVRRFDRSVFTLAYLIELIFLISISRFYFRSQLNRNFSYWGISLLFGLYLVRVLLQYTFIQYYPGVIYLVFMAFFFLGICAYTMSSPVFYPRVQWWEYDFRFRADFKVQIRKEEKNFPARLTDLRRNAGCIEAFEEFNIGEILVVHLNFEGKEYELPFVVKTIRQRIPGRPFQYGVIVTFRDKDIIKIYKEIKSLWDENKMVKLRNKFNQKSF